MITSYFHIIPKGTPIYPVALLPLPEIESLTYLIRPYTHIRSTEKLITVTDIKLYNANHKAVYIPFKERIIVNTIAYIGFYCPENAILTEMISI